MSEQQNLPAIEMRGVSVATLRDPTFIVLQQVNWRVARGEFWVVGGPQHAGKTDLIFTAAGLVPPAAGQLQLFGQDPQTFGEGQIAQRLRIGIVQEGGKLFSHLTIAENVALPLHYHKNLPPAAAALAVTSLLDLVELTPLADRRPANVSANWRQRAALARALILQPELLLLDNPLGGLAARHQFWWLRFLDALWRGHDFFGGAPMTMAATTDDFRPWRNAPRRLALLRDKQFIRLGSWPEIETSDDVAVKELLAAI